MVSGLGGLEVPLLLVGESLGDQYKNKTATEDEVDRVPGRSNICGKLRDEEDYICRGGDEVEEDLVEDVRCEGGLCVLEYTF